MDVDPIGKMTEGTNERKWLKVEPPKDKRLYIKNLNNIKIYLPRS